MTQTLLVKKDKGLDLLAQGLVNQEVGGITPENFLAHIDSALGQLETDDTISPELTDQIADSLVEAQELFLDGQAPWQALEEMLSAYQKAKGERSFFQQWVDKANALEKNELRTELWDQFQRACTMVGDGQGYLLTKWLDKKLRAFQTRKRDYEGLSVTSSEVTMESTMCHLFLSCNDSLSLAAFCPT